MTETVYIDSDPRNNSTLYMYSEHHGANYFRSYNHSRDLTLSYLSANIKLENGSLLSVQEQLRSDYYNHSSLQPLPKSLDAKEEGRRKIDTKSICESLVSQILCSNERDDDLMLFWVSFYVKKIEVGKRIFNFYDSLGKPKKDRGEVDFEGYSLLSASIGLFISNADVRITKKIKFLNALLKLNDVLAFQLKEQNKPNPLNGIGNKNSLLAASGIQSEQRLVEQLIKSKGIVNVAK